MGDNKLWDESEKIKKLKEIFEILEAELSTGVA